MSAHERKEWPSRRATPAASRPSVPRLGRARVQTRLGSRRGASKTAPNTTWVHGGAARWEGGGLGRQGCMEGWDEQADTTGVRRGRGDRPVGMGGEVGGSQRWRQHTAPPQVAQGLAASERGGRQVTSAAHVVRARGGRRLSTRRTGEGGRAGCRGRRGWREGWRQQQLQAMRCAERRGGGGGGMPGHGCACEGLGGRCRRARGRPRRSGYRAGGPWSKQIVAARCRRKKFLREFATNGGGFRRHEENPSGPGGW